MGRIVLTKIFLLIVLTNMVKIWANTSNTSKRETFIEFPNDWNITFNLFLPNDRNKQIVLNFTANDTTIKNSGFDPKLRTKFIIHGWINSYYKPSSFKTLWMKDIKDYILDQIKANVIVVDWSTPAGSLNYIEVLPKVEITGGMVANFIKRLIKLTKASANDMHCIGFSLGAHVCGFAGRSLAPNKMAQITGLDPAWPGFDKKFYYPPEIIPLLTPLNSRDANLVLVIHTSSGFYSSGQFNLFGIYGNPNSLGDYDFYINGGNIQPICQQMNKIMSAFTSSLTMNFSEAADYLIQGSACPHEMSFVYPIAKPVNSCQLIAYKCPNFTDFESGKCGDEGMPLGFDFDFYDNRNNKLNETNPPNNHFIKTSDSSPFCLFHYQIVVLTEGEVLASETKLTLFTRIEVEITLNLWPKSQQNLYYHLYTSEEELGTVSHISYGNNGLNIRRVYINYLSHINKRIRKEKSSMPRIVQIKKATSWSDWFSRLIG